MEAIASSIVDKISGCLVDPIKKQFGYFIFLNSNVESLKDKMKKLEDERVGFQSQVEAATRNVEEINPTIKTWLNNVDAVMNAGKQIIDDKEKFPKGCFNEWFLNLKWRYILSRKAKEKTREIRELQVEKKPENVSLRRAPIPFVVSTSTQTFGSRESIINEVIMNLKDENINIIGVCGMGGVGKTTIMNEVFKRVKEEKIFDDYAKTVVSAKADSEKIQRDVADALGLKFQENSMYVRACRLSERLEGEKVLILLDDVWEEIDLQALGITLEECQKSCKILYTSRKKDLWVERQNNKIDVPLDVLVDKEAWDLFRETIGTYLDEKAELQPLARKIVKECAGLPLALVTLGRALIGKSKSAWNDTLLKLRTVSGAQQKVHECLKLSYDHLDDEEAKSLFLLCGLFDEDSEILVENLVDMGMGLKLFNGIYSVNAARDRVIALVEHLNSCCLASSLEVSRYKSPGAKFIRIHDLVRDVSKQIASTEKGALVVDPDIYLRGSQEQVTLGNSLWLSVISSGTDELLTMLKCPRLELLHFQGHYYSQLPDSFFEGMMKLQVANINYNKGFPSSLQFLTRLRTLRLIRCDCGDLTAIGNLKSLEILRIVDGSIEVLPEQIGHLTNLMLLDVSGCHRLKKISDGVISSLIHLEELYLGANEIDWGREEKEEIVNMRQKVSSVRIVHCKIKDPSVIQRFPLLFSNLKKYCITIGEGEAPTNRVYGNYERVLSISFKTFSYLPYKRDLSFLVQNTEVLFLKGKFTKDLAHDFIREGSQVIKRLELFYIDTPQYLFNTIRPLEGGDFAKLENLHIGCCEQMKNVFQLSSTAGSSKLEFPKLKTLDIAYMPSLVSFCNGAAELEFHRLTYLRLVNLPMVECLFLKLSDQSSSDSGEYPSQSFFPRKVSFPSVVGIDVFGLENMKEIWGRQLQAGSFYNLAKLSVSWCPSMQKLFTTRIATHLVELQTLILKDCSELKEVVSKEEEEGEKSTTHIFPKLKYVDLEDMPALEIFCHVEHDLEFSMLETVRISKCPKIKTFTFGSVNTPKLYDVKFYHILFAYEETLWKGNLNGTIQCLHECEFKSLQLNDVDTRCRLSALESLSLMDVNNLQHLTNGPLEADSFANLEYINIEKCEQLTNVFQVSSTAGSTKLEFPNLIKLKIENLPCLISFSNGATEVEFHRLENLSLIGLPKVECIFSKANDHSDSGGDPSRSMFPHKVSLPSVMEIDIIGLENMKEIWGGQIQAGSFFNLAKLCVSCCPSLKKLFTLRIATYLVELQILILSDCSELKEVVSEEEEEGEKSTTNIFPKLMEVELKNMPALERFCHVEHDLDFTMLQKVRIFKCPKIKTFAPGFVKTPNLDGRKLYSKEYGDMSPKGNLNATIQHLHERQQEQQPPLEEQ